MTIEATENHNDWAWCMVMHDYVTSEEAIDVAAYLVDCVAHSNWEAAMAPRRLYVRDDETAMLLRILSGHIWSSIIRLRPGNDNDIVIQ